MRLSLAAVLIASAASTGAAFSTTKQWGRRTALFSTVEADTEASVSAPKGEQDAVDLTEVSLPAGLDAEFISTEGVIGLTSDEIKARMDAQLAKLREKDQGSTQLKKEDINVVFEDKDIVVVNKPSGVLTVSSGNEFPSLAQAVYDSFGCEMGSADRMVVHRLGMDTSGLIVFAKTMDAVRGMNAIFRNRQIERKYEALVCGLVEKDQGMIDLPIMRDYEFPPYVRISTDEHQSALVDLDPEVVGKKLLERPKESITKYDVVSREEFDGQPVTRVSLSSISGRYHQLNVHLAAFGHPIVGDTTYGINGHAARSGGLTAEELDLLAPNAGRAGADLQQSIANAATVPCVHAQSLRFRHPVTNQELSLSVDSTF